MIYAANIFASTYGCGAYGGGTYATNSCATTTGGTTGSGSVLTNTGFDLLLVATLAVTIIFIALLVRFWKRPGKQSSTPQLRRDNENDDV